MHKGLAVIATNKPEISDTATKKVILTYMNIYS